MRTKAAGKKQAVERPGLGRVSLLKRVLQGFRVRLDEELQPHGITTAQLRVLWAVEQNPETSGARIARMCSVTPQTGQALLARMEAHGWICRRTSRVSDRILVAELTTKGRRVLQRAKDVADALDRTLWAGNEEAALAAVDAVLGRAVTRLER